MKRWKYEEWASATTFCNTDAVEYGQSLKVPVMKSFENEISLNWQMVTFPTITSSMVEKLQICISFLSNLRKQCLCYLLFHKWWKTRFLISKRVFRWFLCNYTDFARKISHMKPSKYDSTSGTKIFIPLKKGWGMRLWIRTSTFYKMTQFSLSTDITDTNVFTEFEPVWSKFKFDLALTSP